jgi:hypothetical protein
VLPSSRLEDNIIDLTFEFVRYKVRVFLDINSRVGFNSSVQVISLSCKWSNDTFPEWRHAILIAYNCFFSYFTGTGIAKSIMLTSKQFVLLALLGQNLGFSLKPFNTF